MYKYLLQDIQGVQWFGIAALLIFFTTFCVAIYRAYFIKGLNTEKLSRMPLED